MVSWFRRPAHVSSLPGRSPDLVGQLPLSSDSRIRRLDAVGELRRCTVAGHERPSGHHATIWNRFARRFGDESPATARPVDQPGCVTCREQRASPAIRTSVSTSAERAQNHCPEHSSRRKNAHRSGAICSGSCSGEFDHRHPISTLRITCATGRAATRERPEQVHPRSPGDRPAATTDGARVLFSVPGRPRTRVRRFCVCLWRSGSRAIPGATRTSFVRLRPTRRLRHRVP